MNLVEFAILDRWSALNERALLDNLINKIVSNPFSVFKKMEFNLDAVWDKEPDALKALRNMEGGDKRTVAFGTREPYYFKMSFDKDKIQNTIVGEIQRDFFVALPIGCLVDYVKTLSHDFPSFFFSKIDPIEKISDFYDHHNIEEVPASCIRLYVSWWHMMSPAAYSENYTREDMLGIPAYKLTEHDNAWIEIQVWDTPFEYEKKENLDRLRLVTQYLIEKRKELK